MEIHRLPVNGTLVPSPGELRNKGLTRRIAPALTRREQRWRSTCLSLPETQAAKASGACRFAAQVLAALLLAPRERWWHYPLAEAALRMIEASAGDLNEIKEILRDIVHDDVRAAQVIDRLRALLERGDMLRRPVDLNVTIDEVLELAKSELITRHVRVTTSLDTTAPVVMADRVQMQQIVLNLLMNACEAMSNLPVADRKVTLATRFLPEESCIRVTMTDNGCGIPPGEVERIFQPFVTNKPNGMGMGLAICRSVAEAHRGRLWADSSPGGATFHLQVPVGGVLA
jgi:signal transduction histidine kinase